MNIIRVAIVMAVVAVHINGSPNNKPKYGRAKVSLLSPRVAPIEVVPPRLKAKKSIKDVSKMPVILQQYMRHFGGKNNFVCLRKCFVLI